MKEVLRAFTISEQGALDPEDRAQRTLSKSRIPEIKSYLLDHENDWVFPSLTASFDAEETFRPASTQNPNLGTLEVPFDTDFFINDGQHRRAAVEEAVRENPALGDQHGEDRNPLRDVRCDRLPGREPQSARGMSGGLGKG